MIGRESKLKHEIQGGPGILMQTLQNCFYVQPHRPSWGALYKESLYIHLIYRGFNNWLFDVRSVWVALGRVLSRSFRKKTHARVLEEGYQVLVDL